MRSLQRGRAAPYAAGTLLAWSWTRAAAACSSCYLASDATRDAYYLTTALMVAVPLALVVAIGLWLRRAARRAGRASPPLTRSG